LSGPIEEKRPTGPPEEKRPIKRKPRPATARSAEVEASKEKLLATLQKAKETEERLKVAEESISNMKGELAQLQSKHQATIQEYANLWESYEAKLKAATWWKTQNWNGDAVHEVYALQQFLVAEFPHNIIPKMTVKVIRASFCRVGHGTWVILAESDRLLLTSDHGLAHFNNYHVLGWQQGTETEPTEIYTPVYYDPGRHKTVEEIRGVIEKAEWVNAEKKFWELAKGVS